MKISSHPDLIDDPVVRAVNDAISESKQRHWQVAKVLSLSRGGFSKLMRRPEDVRERLPEIAKALGTTPEAILKRTETQPLNGHAHSGVPTGIVAGPKAAAKERPAMTIPEESLSEYSFDGYRAVPVADEYRGEFSDAMYALLLPSGHVAKDGELVAWRSADGGYKLKWFHRDRRMGIIVLTSRTELYGPECFKENESHLLSVVVGFLYRMPPRKGAKV